MTSSLSWKLEKSSLMAPFLSSCSCTPCGSSCDMAEIANCQSVMDSLSLRMRVMPLVVVIVMHQLATAVQLNYDI